MVWPGSAGEDRGLWYKRTALSRERCNTSCSNKGDEVMQSPSLCLQHSCSWGAVEGAQQSHLHQAGRLGMRCELSLRSKGRSEPAPDCSRDTTALRCAASSCQDENMSFQINKAPLITELQNMWVFICNQITKLQ